jgi:Terminase large subunit, T4likevirus-type, N-terminal
VDYRPLGYQYRVLRSEKERIAVLGGVGVGKTDCGSVFTLVRAKEAPEGVYGIIAANTYQQLIDVTIRNFFKNLDAWGVPHLPKQLPGSSRPFTVRVWNGARWVEHMCRSLDAHENLSGLEAGYWWCDEAWQTTRAAIDTLLARDRDKRMPRNQGLFTTTLDEPTSWMYETFVERFDERLMDVIYAPTWLNAKNLPEGYIRRLKAMYSTRMYQRMVEAKWVTLASGQVYYAFDRKVHVQAHAEFDPHLPILWTHDFNIGQNKPMSSALCQIRRAIGKDGWRPELVVFDEIVSDSSDTNDIIAEFRARGWQDKLKTKHAVWIYGDASGRAHDTRSRTSDYKILADAGFVQQRVPLSNPPVRDRHNSANALLRNAAGDVRCYIHPRCTTLAKGLETVRTKQGAQYVEEQTREAHVSCAWGYLVQAEFSATGPRAGEMELPV